jgi:CubicO group peptidase (beta-lactamase class C family)
MIKRISFLYSFILFIAASSSSYAQTTDWQALLETWRKEYYVPGMSVGIINKGEIILASGFGSANGSRAVDKNTLFAIASNTKAFISASIAQLVDEGKVDWDDPVQEYLPYFELYDPCVSEMTTIRDLLCHRTGLGTFSGDVIWYRNQMSAEDVVRHAKHIPKAFEFRNGYGYSNVMYIAAGEVIRAVSGMSWDQYVKMHFLQPLQMNNTLTSTKDLATSRNVATPYMPDDDQNIPIDWVEWGSSGAAGGILSSADDMLKWINMQLHNGIAGKDTFFTRAQQQNMWTPHVNFPVSDRARELFGGRNFNGYGLGWSTSEYNGKLMISHTGGYDGMYSAVVILPTEKIGIVILTNTMRSIGTNLAYEIIDKLLGAPQKEWKDRGIKQDTDYQADRAGRVKQRVDARTLNTIPTMDNETISGTYRSPMYGDIRIAEENGQLTIDFVQAPDLKAKLTHWHYDTYQIEWIKKQSWFNFGTVQFSKDNSNQPISLLFDVPNDDIFFEEIEADRVE